MGPVIDQSARERVLSWIGRTEQDAAGLIRDGRLRIPGRGFFVGPTLFDSVNQNLLDELRGVDVETLKPEDALKILQDIRKRIV